MAELGCLVCGERWPAGTPRCPCGYDFETRDPSVAIRRLTHQVRHGNRIWRRGLVALVLLPVTFFMIDALPTAALAAMVQLMCSTWWIVTGLIKADRATKQLVAAKQLGQLPPARVIERPRP